uniref:Bestrophin homolog n=2 Tax=Eutreptiella gymnastica TaxID=73025 RepID=A0A7S1HWI6_9EUGL|mmetsp:Transcript_11056/g.19795  ORF Transcript_11056/g.19795 Transcript_11056/m.19795 type:complete len:315 (+) Transcript_11056:163-1107(+)
MFFTDTIWSMMRIKDLLFCVVNVLAVWLCIQGGAPMPIQPTLLLNILLFPLAFAVNAAYARRESALAHFASFKSSVLNMYLLYRCWQFEPNLPLDFLKSGRTEIQQAYDAVRDYLMCRREERKKSFLLLFYQKVAEIALIHDILRLSGIPPPLVASAVGNLRGMTDSFEHLRCFADYRTPSTIRAFIRLCQYAVPLLMAPYFADLAVHHSPILAYASAAFIAIPFLLLNNVQGSLENPFAGATNADPDDIRLDALQIMDYMNEDQTEIQQRLANLTMDEDDSFLKYRPRGASVAVATTSLPPSRRSSCPSDRVR